MIPTSVSSNAVKSCLSRKGKRKSQNRELKLEGWFQFFKNSSVLSSRKKKKKGKKAKKSSAFPVSLFIK